MSFYRLILCAGVLFIFQGCGGSVSPETARAEVKAMEEREAAEKGMTVEEMEAAEEAEEAAEENEL